MPGYQGGSKHWGQPIGITSDKNEFENHYHILSDGCQEEIFGNMPQR
jgi:hypothetical protein